MWLWDFVTLSLCGIIMSCGILSCGILSVSIMSCGILSCGILTWIRWNHQPAEDPPGLDTVSPPAWWSAEHMAKVRNHLHQYLRQFSAYVMADINSKPWTSQAPQDVQQERNHAAYGSLRNLNGSTPGR